MAETQSGATGEEEEEGERGREGGKRAPHVLSGVRGDDARRQTGRLAERVGTHSGMMGNKGFVCHRRDRINQNKQPRTDCLSDRLSHPWMEEMDGGEEEEGEEGAPVSLFM